MLDLILTQRLQLLDPDILYGPMKFFTDLGEFQFILIFLCLTSAILWKSKKYLETKLLFICTATTALLGTILKIIINRPRPTPDLVQVFIDETSKSFPSNHALISLVFFGLIAIFVNKKPVTFSLSLLIFLIGLSRIYLGVHWTSDILGGYLIGGLILYIVNKYYIRNKHQSPRITHS